MKFIKCSIMILVFFLCSCKSEYSAHTNPEMISDSPIYQMGSEVYYEEVENYQHKLMCNDQLLKELGQSTSIASIYANETDIYYSCKQAIYERTLYRMNKETGISEVVFKIEDPQYDEHEFICEKNGIIYYFANRTLWAIKNNSIETVLNNVIDCSIDGNVLYYTNINGLYRNNLDKTSEELLLSNDDILNSGLYQELTNVQPVGYVQNIVLYDNNIYFLFSPDSYSVGGLYCYNRDEEKLTSENLYATRFTVEEDKIYCIGIKDEGIEGLLEVDFDGNCKVISSDRIYSFYVGDKVYYYTYSDEKNGNMLLNTY